MILFVPTKGTAFANLALGIASSCTGSLQPGRKYSHLQNLMKLCWSTGSQGCPHMLLWLSLRSPWNRDTIALFPFALTPTQNRPRSKATVYLETVKIEHLDTRLEGSKQVKFISILL